MFGSMAPSPCAVYGLWRHGAKYGVADEKERGAASRSMVVCELGGTCIAPVQRSDHGQVPLSCHVWRAVSECITHAACVSVTTTRAPQCSAVQCSKSRRGCGVWSMFCVLRVGGGKGAIDGSATGTPQQQNRYPITTTRTPHCRANECHCKSAIVFAQRV